MWKQLKWIGAALTICLCGFSAQAQFLFGANGAGGNPATVLVRINATTGAATPIGPIGFAVTGLAIHPLTGVLYGSTGAAAPVSPNSLITINPTTGAGTLVGPTGLGGPVADITFRADGTLFGWCECSDDLATINTATGVGAIVSDAGIGTAGSGIAFVGPTLFFAGNGASGALRTVNPVTGLTTAGPNLNGAPLPGNQISAMSASPSGVLFASNLADVGGGGAAFLVTINTTTGVVTTIGPTIAGLDAIVFAGGGPAAAPTLSEWNMILLVLLLVGTAMWALRKRRG